MGYRIPLVRPAVPGVDELVDDLRVILSSGRLSNFGPYLRDFERRSAEFLEVDHAVAVSNATTGLCLLLNTLPEGSEVIVPSFTFLPTVQAVVWNRLRPRFVDIDPETFCLSTDGVEESLGEKTSAILAVNVFGAPCAVEPLEKIARSHGIRLFFDSAHAFGSTRRGRHAGGFGDAEVFSCSVTKLLPGGEGGLVTTRRAEIRDAIRDRRNYGFLDRDSPAAAMTDGQDCHYMGLNGKMTEFAALLCLKGIDKLTGRVARRNTIARRYRERLSRLPGISFQRVDEGDVSTYKDFTIVLEESATGISRDDLARSLAEKSIETGRYFYPPVHRLTYFRKYAEDAGLTHTDALASRILSLPIYSDLSEDELEDVTERIEETLCTPAH